MMGCDTRKWGGSVFLFAVGIWIIHHQIRPSVMKADDSPPTAAVRFQSFPPPTSAEASAAAKDYASWLNSAIRPTWGINRSEPLLGIVKPLDAELETLTPKCVGPSTPVWAPLGKPSTLGKIVVLKLRKVMAEANCVWWITNGGPFALARSTALKDEDLDVAYICRSDPSLPYYECEQDRHHCTASAFASVEARLAELLAREFRGAKVARRKKRGHISISGSPELPSCRGCSKVVDLAPAAVLSRYIRSGVYAPCSSKIGGRGWPCTRWHIETVFPLQPCLVDGVVVPCPADVARYSSFDNQFEYVAGYGKNCHGCSLCLLWPGNGDRSVVAVDLLIAGMQRLNSCGFATMMGLVSTLVVDKSNSSRYCGCGVGSTAC